MSRYFSVIRYLYDNRIVVYKTGTEQNIYLVIPLFILPFPDFVNPKRFHCRK